MVAELGRSIVVRGDGNIVAGRDVNIGSTSFSIDLVPTEYRREFDLLEAYVRSSRPAEKKRGRVRKFAQDLTTAGFGSIVGAVVAHLLALI